LWRRARIDLNSNRENGGWWGKNLVTVLFYSGDGNTVNTQKANSQLPIAEKQDFLKYFFLLRLHSGKRKHSHPLTNYSTLLPSTGFTFQNKGKVLDTVQLLDIPIRVLSSKNLTMTRVCTHTSWLPEQSLLQLDWPEAVTKYKFGIPIKGIMIIIFREKSFKSLEAAYSNRLAKSLVASCKGISPSP